MCQLTVQVMMSSCRFPPPPPRPLGATVGAEGQTHVNMNSRRQTTCGNIEPALVFRLWVMWRVAADEKSHPMLCLRYYLDH